MTNLETMNYVGPHELHVTTDPAKTDPVQFRESCDQLGVKAHVIYNEQPDGGVVIDYLTGSEIHGRTEEAFVELHRISRGLAESGLAVVREKIETHPEHPAAPRSPFDSMPQGSYFEAHFTLPDLSTMRSAKVWERDGVPFLISTTDSKREAGLLFATMRYYTATASAFCDSVDAVHTAVQAQMLEAGLGGVKKPVVEFAVHDTNPEHDKDWVNAYRIKKS